MTQSRPLKGLWAACAAGMVVAWACRPGDRDVASRQAQSPDGPGRSDVSGDLASRPGLDGAGPRRDWSRIAARVEGKGRALAERGPKRFDEPQKAMDFFLEQRLPPGQSLLPLEHLQRTRAAVLARERVAAAGGAGGASLPVWSEIGPTNVGGRTRAIVIDPVDPDVVYAAGVAGGVWKSTNGGLSWAATDDFMLNLAVSSLVMDPTDRNVLYAGTGEGFFNGDSVRGLGIFKTVDAGSTWTQLSGTVSSVPTGAFYQVNELAISPADANRVYACTRFGVWVSHDGGGAWSVLLQNPQRLNLSGVPLTNGCSIGCSDLALRNDTAPGPDVILAAFGSFRPDGLFRSLDGGATWSQVGTTGDLRVANQGRMEIAIAPSDNEVMYVSMADNNDTGNPTGAMVNVFRSLDGGTTWSPRLDFGNPTSRLLLSNLPFGNGCFGFGNFSQGWYDNVIAVDPMDPEVVWVGGVDLFRSDDGGRNFGIASYWYFDRHDVNYVHADHHALVFHPAYDGSSNQTLYSGSDGGVARTDNARAATSVEGCPFPPNDPLPGIQWTQRNEGYGTVQFYQGDAARGGGAFGGGTQDNGTWLVDAAATPAGWARVLGGDGGYFFIDPFNSLTMYAETQGFPQIRKSVDGGMNFFLANSGITDQDGLFISPYTVDQRFPNILWTGGSRPWRTTNAAASWTLAGPDLPDAGTLSAVAVAPSDSEVVYLGFSNGLVARTTNALPGLPAWTVYGYANGLQPGFVSSVAVHPQGPDIAYCTYSTFGVEHILRTADGGQTWVSIDGPEATGVPDIPVHWLAIRPCNPAELYAGTELGVFMSDNEGASWFPANTGLAHTVVETLDFPDADTLVAFTHGRGVFRAELSPSCSGACCVDGACVGITTEPECFDQGGLWFAGQDCSTTMCTGACCNDETGACFAGLTAAACAQSGGSRYVAGESCGGLDPGCGALACCTVDDGGTPGDPSDDASACEDLLPKACEAGGGTSFPGAYCSDPGLPCPDPACINASGDCGAPHGGLGCADAQCCNQVCDLDARCCEDGWDDSCAALAASNCRLNDECAAAAPIFEGVTSFSTIGATTDGPADCLSGDPSVGTNDIWFAYEARCSGELSVSLCEGTDYDNTLQIYEGRSCDPLGNQLGCGDDSCGSVGGPAKLIVPVERFRTYLLRVGGWGGSVGTGRIKIVCGSGVPDPLEAEPDGVDKNRVVTFKASSTLGSPQTAIRVIVRRMYVDRNEEPLTGCPPRTEQPDLSRFDGIVRWLGPPAEFVDRSVPPMPNFLAAPLQCCPHFRNWSKPSLSLAFGVDADATVMHAYGPEVVPCSIYELQAVDGSCAETLDEDCFSEPLAILTAEWGDVWEPFGGPQQPTFVDIGAIVQKFKSIPFDPGPPPSGGPRQPQAMLRGNTPPLEQAVSFIDIGKCVDGFKQLPYREVGPDPSACSEPCGASSKP